MTITESHREVYQSTVDQFTTQSREDTCLPISIFNIIDELADRQEAFNPDFDFDDVLEWSDYRPGFGSSAEYLPERLKPVLQDHGYEINIETELSLDEIDSIIEDGQSSYPVTELDPQYFHYAEGYQVQEGMYAEALPHTVIPFKFNSDTVLYFDPYEDFYADDTGFGAPPRELSKVKFYELWSGKAKPRWTFWVEESPQQRLDQVEQE